MAGFKRAMKQTEKLLFLEKTQKYQGRLNDHLEQTSVLETLKAITYPTRRDKLVLPPRDARTKWIFLRGGEGRRKSFGWRRVSVVRDAILTKSSCSLHGIRF